jgi:hypothetical protein
MSFKVRPRTIAGRETVHAMPEPGEAFRNFIQAAILIGQQVAR